MYSTRTWLLCGFLALCLLGFGCGSKKEAPKAKKAAPAAKKRSSESEEEGNRPPMVGKVTISPADPCTNDDFSVEAEASDPDDDNITLRFQWYLNGEKLLGQIDESLSSSFTTHGDSVEVEVVALDAEDESEPKRSASVEVRNSPPELVGKPSPGTSLDGYRMVVSDLDDDPISYRLEGAPPNMTLDASGTLHWNALDSDQEGDYQVTMIAEDDQGASVTVKFPVHVNPPTKPQ